MVSDISAETRQIRPRIEIDPEWMWTLREFADDHDLSQKQVWGYALRELSEDLPEHSETIAAEIEALYE